MKFKAKKVEKSVIKVEFTEREAVALAAILGSVGGWTNSKDNLRAVIVDKLWNSLDEAGFGTDHDDYADFANHVTRNAIIG